MISTSSYKDFQTYRFSKVSISWDRGKDAGYDGKCYPDLAPKREFWNKWKANRGVISEEENTKYYIEEYYKQVLANLDPEKVYNDLNYSTLLCYEESDQFCHRHIVAAWLNLLLGDTIHPVMEVRMIDGVLTYLDDVSSKYSEILEDAIRRNENMYGFSSVRARYLFEQSEKLEELANKMEEENPGICCDDLRQSACYKRCDADEAEAEYKAVQKEKKNKGADN